MRLEMATFPVEEVKFGGQTSYNSGVLGINYESIEFICLSSRGN